MNEGATAMIVRKAAPASVMRVSTLVRYSAVRAPGRRPGTKAPCSRRLSAISLGWNIRRFQKKQKKKISAAYEATCMKPVGVEKAYLSVVQPIHSKTIAGTMKITEANTIGITPAMLILSGRKWRWPP